MGAIPRSTALDTTARRFLSREIRVGEGGLPPARKVQAAGVAFTDLSGPWGLILMWRHGLG